MGNTRIFGLAALAAAVAVPAFAVDNSWYVVPSASYVIEDDERGTDRDDNTGGVGVRLSVGRAVSEHVNFELTAFGSQVADLDDTAGQDQGQWGVGADFLLLPKRGGTVSPYALVGFGGQRDYVDNNTIEEDDFHLYGDVGLGAIIKLTQGGLTLRPEVRYRSIANNDTDVNESVYEDLHVGLGLGIPLGKAAPGDNDGDGVVNGADRCPNTPAGAAVNAVGCPQDSDRDGVADAVDLCPNTAAGTVVNASGCAGDGDGDGVADNADACPNTPAGALVDPRGCSIDDDSDGVVNSADRCPNTAAGVQVDYNGCEIKDVMNLEGVNFRLNSAELLPTALSILDQAATVLSNYPAMTVEVAGHTDSTGEASYNKDLSQRRAASVRQYLIGRGIDGSRMTPRGYGETQPVASNSTRAGRVQNRRTEFRILSR